MLCCKSKSCQPCWHNAQYCIRSASQCQHNVSVFHRVLYVSSNSIFLFLPVCSVSKQFFLLLSLFFDFQRHPHTYMIYLWWCMYWENGAPWWTTRFNATLTFVCVLNKQQRKQQSCSREIIIGLLLLCWVFSCASFQNSNQRCKTDVLTLTFHFLTGLSVQVHRHVAPYIIHKSIFCVFVENMFVCFPSSSIMYAL